MMRANYHITKPLNMNTPEMSSDPCESLDHRDPPFCLVLIPVLISRIKIGAS